jgi:hypothetical protein
MPWALWVLILVLAHESGAGAEEYGMLHLLLAVSNEHEDRSRVTDHAVVSAPTWSALFFKSNAFWKRVNLFEPIGDLKKVT